MKRRSLGINDLIIDPGFGFAKTIDQNYEVMRKTELFQLGIATLLEYPENQ
jgi:dihydropteroate synthase